MDELTYHLGGEDGARSRFWRALHHFQDASNEFKREPIIASSCPVPGGLNVTAVRLNSKLAGADHLLRTVAMAAGVMLIPK